MAYYVVNHLCGHTARIQIYGTNVHGEREAKAARLGDQPCPDCRRAAEHATAAESALVLDLPQLTGSDKQVAWAVVLRDRAFRRLDAALDDERDSLADLDARREVYREILAAVDSAAMWIDYRDRIEHPVPDLITALAAAPGRARLRALTTDELAPLLSAAATDSDPTLIVEDKPVRDIATVRTIPVPEGQGGPDLKLPAIVSRALTVWRETFASLADPARITRLRRTAIVALTEATLPAHLARLAVRTAAAATNPPGVTDEQSYTAARLLLDEYQRQTRAPAPVSDDPSDAEQTSTSAWWIRARVRMLRSARHRNTTVAPGQELVLIQYGLPGWPKPAEAWFDIDPATALDLSADLEDVFCVAADDVEIIEILDTPDPATDTVARD
ncbi:hypothetical protein [Nocardia noduli]|uniref:hypothetical protein n=1 Tax=Nocardia noduli TaxID=2815722 RepID=UPI001C245B1A|nr:hypothetical protein [Nocardia noduli]